MKRDDTATAKKVLRNYWHYSEGADQLPTATRITHASVRCGSWRGVWKQQHHIPLNNGRCPIFSPCASRLLACHLGLTPSMMRGCCVCSVRSPGAF